jgi:hypothetical protein
MVYLLGDGDRERLLLDLEAIDGLDLLVMRTDGEAVVRSARGELRFAPDGDLVDRRGGAWSVEGDHAALELQVEDGLVTSAAYPDALARLWSALSCPYAGDVLVSAAPGWEFVDWGGADHVGGGSHGSLLADDSEGVLLATGVELPEREQWSIADVSSLVLRHFSLPSPLHE